MSNNNDNARKLDKSRSATRTKEVIEALNAPATQLEEHWFYYQWWRKNWAIADLTKKRAMLEA